MPVAQADVVETVWYNEDANQPLTVNKPSLFGPGEILVAIHVAHGGTLTDMTAAAGWTLEDSESVSSLVAKVWSHPYNAGDPSSWNFGYNSAADTCLGLFRINAADLTPIITVTSTGFGETTSSMDSPTVTPTDYNDLLICGLAFWGNGTPLTETDPPGMSDLGQTAVAGDFMSLTAVKEQLATSNPTGVRTWTGVPTVATPGMTWSIAVDSSGVYDPDPPRMPPPPIVPPWMLRELALWKQQRFEGSQGVPTPVVKQTLSGFTDGGSVNLNTAATTLDTDLLVAFHGADFDVASNMTTPTAGTWTLQATGDQGTNTYHVKIWTRTATAGANSVTFPAVGSSENFGAVLVISGADLTDPSEDAAGSNGSASTSHVAPSVTAITPSALLLNMALAAVCNYTPPPPAALSTERAEIDGNFSTMTVASQALGAAGATGTKTFLSSVSSVFATASIAIRPAGAVVGPVSYDADATLAVTATLAADATADRPAAAALALTATLTAALTADRPATAGLAVTATLTAAADRTAVAAAALAVTTTLAAATTADRPAAAALAVTATLAAATTADRPAAAALAVTATLTVAGTVTTGVINADATLVVTATLSAAATRTAVVAASLAATATLTTAADRLAIADATLAVTATLAAAGTGTRPAAASLTVTATLASSATRTAIVAASLSTTATLTAGMQLSAVIAAPLAITATLTAAAVVGAAPIEAAAALSVTATLTVAGARTAIAAADLSVTVTLVAAGTPQHIVAAVLSVTATLTAGAGILYQAGAVLAIVTSLVANATVLGSLTQRPNSGTTTRPGTGGTPRPVTTSTARPASTQTLRPITTQTPRP